MRFYTPLMWTFFLPLIHNRIPHSVKWFQINGICVETDPALKKVADCLVPVFSLFPWPEKEQ